MVTIERISDFSDFIKLETCWNSILKQSEVDIPFLTFEWLSCWWKSYGANSELFVLVIKEDQEIIGFAPLMKTRTKLRCFNVRAIEFIANFHSNRCGFILTKNKSSAIDAILVYLGRQSKEYDLLVLNLIEENSSTDLGLQTSLRNKDYRYLRINSSTSPFLAINTVWDSFFSTLPKGFRKEISYRKRLIAKNQSVSFVEYYQDNIFEALRNLLSVSRSTWQYNNGTAIASEASNINFYCRLAQLAAKKSWLNISFLNTDSGPVAFEFKLIFNRTTYLLKMGFNAAYSRFSPGVILLEHAIKNAFGNGSKEFDFLGESDQYKLQWTSQLRFHKKYWIFSSSLTGSLLYIFEVYIVQKAKLLKFYLKNFSLMRH